MTKDQKLAKAATEFVDLLTPGNFHLAEKFISPECEYSYAGNVLKGKAVLQSFIDNHENASKKLDKIQYDSSEIESIEGNTVSVLVANQLYVKDKIYLYRDRLIVTFKEDEEPKTILRIENKRVDGERDKLMAFFRSCGIDWT
jgi:hypothetical protein